MKLIVVALVVLAVHAVRRSCSRGVELFGSVSALPDEAVIRGALRGGS